MKILLFFILSFLVNLGYSQDNNIVTFESNKKYTQTFIDSLIKDPEIRLSLGGFKKMLESNKSLQGWPHYYYGMSAILYREAKLDSVIYFADKGIQSFQNSQLKRPLDERTLIVIYFLKGRALKEKKDAFNAIIAFQKGLELSKKHSYKWDYYVEFDIANTYKLLGNNSQALNYYHLCTKDSLIMTREGTNIYNSFGFIYGLMNVKDSSVYYSHKALKRAKVNEELDQAQISYLNLGSFYRKREQIDSAKYYYQLAKLNTEINHDSVLKLDEELKSATKIHQYYILLNNKENKRVISELPLILDSVTALMGERVTKEELDYIVAGNDYLSEAFFNEQVYEKGIQALKRKNKLLLSFNDQIQKEKIEQLEIEYQTKEKDASITQLEQSKKQQDTIIKQQRTIAFGLGGLFLLTILMGVLFFKQRKLKSKYEKENLEQRLLRSQMNPHFIGNAMNTVSALVSKKSNDAIPYINKLSNLFRLVLINSREEFVSLEDELATINSYLELQSKFSKDFDFNFSIDNSINKEEIIIPPMLIQPFVENAILHGLKSNNERGKVNIEITKNSEGLLLCKIDDNGVGYSNTINKKNIKNRKSVSGDIIEERLKIFKNKFKVNSRFLISSTDQGTSVELYLPYLLDT